MSVTLIQFSKIGIFDLIWGILLISFISANPVKEDKRGEWICMGRNHGDQIPHPEDCSLYFICDRESSKLSKCQDGLHYDPNGKVCNWPKAANCQLGNYPKHWDLNSSLNIPTVEPENFKPSFKPEIISTIKPEIHTAPTAIDCVTQHGYKTATVKPKNSTIGSTDENGKHVDPMKTYDPIKVQCLYGGVYFLPHPSECRSYFICANHVLYMHSCGISTNWNYMSERCDYDVFAVCYGENVVEKKELQENTTKQIKKKRLTKKPLPKKTTIATAETEQTMTTTELFNNGEFYMTECDSEEQRFFSHPRDCSKYLICAKGKISVAQCPDGLWWDGKEQWCGFPEFTYCEAGKKDLI